MFPSFFVLPSRRIASSASAPALTLDCFSARAHRTAAGLTAWRDNEALHTLHDGNRRRDASQPPPAPKPARARRASVQRPGHVPLRAQRGCCANDLVMIGAHVWWPLPATCRPGRPAAIGARPRPCCLFALESQRPCEPAVGAPTASGPVHAALQAYAAEFAAVRAEGLTAATRRRPASGFSAGILAGADAQTLRDWSAACRDGARRRALGAVDRDNEGYARRPSLPAASRRASNRKRMTEQHRINARCRETGRSIRRSHQARFGSRGPQAVGNPTSQY